MQILPPGQCPQVFLTILFWSADPEFLLDHAEGIAADVLSLLDPDKDPEIQLEVKPNRQVGYSFMLKDHLRATGPWNSSLRAFLVMTACSTSHTLVCKAELKVTRQGTVKTFIRPIAEHIALALGTLCSGWDNSSITKLKDFRGSTRCLRLPKGL